MRILVTNDDGIDSVGLHALALAMRPYGEVIVVAPDREYSGAGAAIGPLHLAQPDVHRDHLDGIDEVWTLDGPPGLCVMLARLGAFGDPFDLVVSGINPGNNVGRSVYHSGTVGAAITARLGGITGVAVSQAVSGWDALGQGVEEGLSEQKWETAAEVASIAVAGIVEHPPAEASVLNLNVPNVGLDEIKGWRHTTLGAPPAAVTGAKARLHPREGHEKSFHLTLEWGQGHEFAEHTDAGAVRAGWVSVTWLGAIGEAENPAPPLDLVLDEHLTR